LATIPEDAVLTEEKDESLTTPTSRHRINSGSLNEPFLLAVHVAKELTLYLVAFPSTMHVFAKQYWQHAGEGISSRGAKFMLNCLEKENNEAGLDDDNDGYQMLMAEGKRAKDIIRERLSDCYFNDTSNAKEIYLYPSGMSAIHQAYALVNALFGPKNIVQFG
jgi:hypothetical protein